MNKRQCVSCGAPIPLGALKCEYCGMTYEPDYWAGTVRYVPIRMHSRRLLATASVPREIVRHYGAEASSHYIKRQMVDDLADALTELMAVQVSEDFMHNAYVVRGSVIVEVPDDGLKGVVFGGD